jgi:tetratricopeptide (TPR) repeat protein
VQPQERGNVDQAVGAYRRILRLNPTHAEASERVAEIYLQTGLPTEAEQILREAKTALQKTFNISHTTLQLEYAQNAGCETASCEGPELAAAPKKRKGRR